MPRHYESKRDFRLPSRLMERVLEHEGYSAEVLRDAITWPNLDEHRDDRSYYELRFDLLNSLRAVVTDTW